MRIAVINEERCNPNGCGNYLCIKVCPVNKELGKNECVFVAPSGKAGIAENLCTGCGICPNRCPFEAISIINLPEQLEHPIHRYGRNGFHLYKLPVPMFGKVVGILGRNGIGKSTAIKILAGMLKPNLGKDNESKIEELITYFKGSEAQIFFEKLKKEQIKISYKPQQVELIAKAVKGKVKDLLKKVDEKKDFNNVVDALGLRNVLDNEITELSGGEFQRVAIAATSLKKANVYIFDEPSSYLDIKQRLLVSKFIKSLTNDETAVLVVEHDLIILDFMTDLIHIMYGKEGTYGITSLPKPSRNGINIFLEGFIRDENMRFRDHQIKFHTRPPLRKKMQIPLLSWSDIRKNLGLFKFEAKEGVINRGSVIGVLGENGIGKTTFVKILAGLTSPDDGSIFDKKSVSYKAQYLESDNEELVASFLHDAISKYELQIIRPLDLKHLLTREVKQLSGGELQRVFIAKCLSTDSDIYLLDEPSAYLDIEQRLSVSKMIRDFAEQRNATVLVVDHDLLFLDYLCDELMVFEGTPAKHGIATGPFSLQEGMNKFLKYLDITLRRDIESNRPRINKPGSVADREQKQEGKLYYT